MSSTRPTAPSRMKAAGRTSCSSAAAHGVAVSRQPSYSANCRLLGLLDAAGDRRQLGVGLRERRAGREPGRGR